MKINLADILDAQNIRYNITASLMKEKIRKLTESKRGLWLLIPLSFISWTVLAITVPIVAYKLKLKSIKMRNVKATIFVGSMLILATLHAIFDMSIWLHDLNVYLGFK